ncbi:MAG: TIGR00303 family protein [Nitrososphaeraceae archaeon]
MEILSVFPSKFQDILSANDTPSSVAKRELASLPIRNPVFVCVISYTATCEIPGITVAGVNLESLKYTSPADAEFLHYGHCKCIDRVPVTPDGKPTPAIITRAALRLSNIPFFVVDAGSKIKPSIPHISFDIPSGKNIQFGNALDIDKVKQAFEYGIILGKQLGRTSSMVVIGESIPGGTTTALGVLTALGIDAKNKTSSSMPQNPHDLKNRTVSEGLKKANISIGSLRNDPLRAVSFLGDPMMPAVAGMVDGVLSSGSGDSHVMLAGGTQMAAILAILKSLGRPLERISVGTTVYVAEDSSSNLTNLIKAISSEIGIYKLDPQLALSSHRGLRAFARGFVKEGVGAGGLSIVAILKSNGQIDGRSLLKAVEQEYDTIMNRIR